MTSHQRHIGPWPIKRSQSVPDASASIHTPRNGPPGFASLLAKVEEGRSSNTFRPISDHMANMRTPQWSDYSLYLPPSRRENNRTSAFVRDGERETQIKIGVMVLKWTVKVSGCMLVLSPLFAVDLVKTTNIFHVSPPERTSTRSLLYALLVTFSMTVGIITAIASDSLAILVRKECIRRRDIRRMLGFGLSIGVAMSAWVMLFVLPRMKSNEPGKATS